MSRLVRLYPEAWRSRYEAELLDVLESRPPTPLERLDVIRGALDAHLHPQVVAAGNASAPAPDDAARVARRLGMAATVGAALWAVAFAASLLGPVRYDGYGAYRDGSGVLPLLLLAVLLLAGGLGGQLLGLPSNARLARSGAAAALLFLILWGIQPWQLWLAAAMVGGLAALATGAWRARAWPARISLAVLLSCGAVVAMVAIGAAISVDRMTGGVLLVVAAAAFLPAWLGVSGTLLRRRA
jgi:hypothetical protein